MDGDEELFDEWAEFTLLFETIMRLGKRLDTIEATLDRIERLLEDEDGEEEEEGP